MKSQINDLVAMRDVEWQYVKSCVKVGSRFPWQGW